MKKITNLGLLLTSLLGYLEWGKNQRSFLFETELELVTKAFSQPQSLLHPFVILPFLGQILLLVTLFQTTPKKYYTLLGMSCIGLLMVMILVVGILSKNIKVVASTIPFCVCAYLSISQNLKKNATT